MNVFVKENKNIGVMNAFQRFCARFIDYFIILFFCTFMHALEKTLKIHIFDIGFNIAPLFRLMGGAFGSFLFSAYDTMETLFFYGIVVAIVMTLLGTTPGKWMMGVVVKPKADVETFLGRFWFYLKRELLLWVKGFGCGFYFALPICVMWQGLRLIKGRMTSYDGQTKLTLRKRPKWIVFILAAIIVTFLAMWFYMKFLVMTHYFFNPTPDERLRDILEQMGPQTLEQLRPQTTNRPR